MPMKNSHSDEVWILNLLSIVDKDFDYATKYHEKEYQQVIADFETKFYKKYGFSVKGYVEGNRKIGLSQCDGNLAIFVAKGKKIVV